MGPVGLNLAHWRKSSYSGGNADCVEVAFGSAAGVRDSKNPGGGHLSVNPRRWSGFLAAVKVGRFDRP
ncbi:DUF397 domain-containing protein [Solihabitans fulvus]|uniref:DUF397 domain-containing protein n=1 Tax=Solihabitans fulvus TaxID=1892852 RepID=A0A5B2X6B8_9PSEU|nr:DUF397 domain-containing protein [Solihabitans fulvus]KAA2258681.1 DUF397 domain-containing protein [Solihabitans fulvus]